MLDTPFKLGFRAGRARRKRGSCPYENGTREFKAWMKWYVIGLRAPRNREVMNFDSACKRPKNCIAAGPGLCRSCSATIRMVELRKDPEFVAKAKKRGSDHLKRMWADADRRARWTDRIRKSFEDFRNSPRGKKQRREIMIALNADPAFKEKARAAAKRHMAKAESKAVVRQNLLRGLALPGMVKRRYRIMVRNGHWLSKKTKEEIITAARDTDETLTSIAKRYGKSPGRIAQIAREAGILRGRPWRKE